MIEREQEILDKTIDVLKKCVDPKRIYFFGSRSNGTHRNGSDFDFAVTGCNPASAVQRNIKNALEEFVGLYQIDIVYLDSVEKDFRDLIFQEGAIIYEKLI